MHKTFDIAPFFSKLIVAIDDNPSKAVTRINLDHPGMDLDSNDEGAAAFTYSTHYRPKGKKNQRQYCVVVFSKADLEPGIVAHEAVHVVNFVMQEVGQKLDKNHDEFEAYLVGWVVDRVYEVKAELDKQTKPTKKK